MNFALILLRRLGLLGGGRHDLLEAPRTARAMKRPWGRHREGDRPRTLSVIDQRNDMGARPASASGSNTRPGSFRESRSCFCCTAPFEPFRVIGSILPTLIRGLIIRDYGLRIPVLNASSSRSSSRPGAATSSSSTTRWTSPSTIKRVVPGDGRVPQQGVRQRRRAEQSEPRDFVDENTLRHALQARQDVERRHAPDGRRPPIPPPCAVMRREEGYKYNSGFILHGPRGATS